MKMASITYRKGDATAPIGDGAKIICHVCNDVGGWGKGTTLFANASRPLRHKRPRAKPRFTCLA